MIIEILISGLSSALHQLISHVSLYCIKYFSGLSSALHQLISHVSLYCIKYFSGLSSALHQLISHVSLYCIKYFSGLSSALHQLISHVSLYCVKYYLYICVCAWFAVITVYVLFVVHKLWLLFSSPCQRQCELLPSLGVRRPLTFHILIFSTETSVKWTETW
jgi:hypothetical protein